MELEIAKCCGTCIHCNKPKKPTNHEPHYSVAKTERWCYLNNIKTTRECVCDCFEINNKRGGVPACKRIFKFNERAKKIMALIEAMKENNIDRLTIKNWSATSYVIHKNWLYEEYKNKIFGTDRVSYYMVDSCSAEFDRIEKLLWQNLKENIN